jgi:hypothetical protein
VSFPEKQLGRTGQVITLQFNPIRRQVPWWFLVIVLSFSSWTGMAEPLSTQPATRSGEFMEFEVFWTKLLAGRINIYNHGVTERAGQLCQKLEAYARTDGAVEAIYESKVRYLGYLRPDSSSWIYEEWEKDSDWRLHSWLEFPEGQSIVKRYKKGRLRNQIEVPPGTLDPVGAVNRLLSLSLTPGDHQEVTVSQGKDLYFATADVTRGPVLETLLGVVETLEVTPHIYFEGKPVGNRVIKAWFTVNTHVPVRLSADIEYGSFSANLVKYRQPCTNPASEPILSWQK